MLPDSVNQFSYVVLLFDFNQDKSKVIVYKELSLGKAYLSLFGFGAFHLVRLAIFFNGCKIEKLTLDGVVSNYVGGPTTKSDEFLKRICMCCK
jgi:hypothetical protein